MSSVIGKGIATLVAAATMATVATPAEAGGRWHRHRDRGDAALAIGAGIVGLGLVAALASRDRYYGGYYDPYYGRGYYSRRYYNHYYYPPPHYGYGYGYSYRPRHYGYGYGYDRRYYRHGYGYGHGRKWRRHWRDDDWRGHRGWRGKGHWKHRRHWRGDDDGDD